MAVTTKKAKLSWGKEDDERLLKTLQEYDNDVDRDYDEDLGEYIAESAFDGKRTGSECENRLLRLHIDGELFATISDIWPSDDVYEKSMVKLKCEPDWEKLKEDVYRTAPPNFRRRKMQNDQREPCEFVETSKGAKLVDSELKETESVTTVNDNLIPVDIFGEIPNGVQKAHLLPRARHHAITWDYPARAVLGLDTMDENVVQKAVLGCQVPRPNNELPIRYPGIRNMLSNIVRLSYQAEVFDTNPQVMIFPIYDLEEAKNWAGEGYDAIVVFDTAYVAKRIGMSTVRIENSKRANLNEINKAGGLASTLCKFLACSVLKKGNDVVSKYQYAEDKSSYEKFRKEKEVAVPFHLEFAPLKPVRKISFEAHDDHERKGHPAPDPMLLAFKSCNNWCRRFSKFRMLAGAEPEDSDDDLSEEGKQNLKDYLEWQAKQEKSLRHNEIMDLFGSKGEGMQFALQ